LDSQQDSTLEQQEKAWEQRHKVDQSPTVKTDLDIEVKAIYTPNDVRHLDYGSQLGFPGEFPFTRGPYPEMSRHKPWRYSVFTGFDTPEDTNVRWKFLYQAGQPAFNVVYDLPSHMGLDPDDPLAEDEVGRVGIPICSTQDIETVFQDLPMGTVPFYGNMETLGAMIVAFYIAAAAKRGIPQEKLPGSISNDPLTTAISKSTTVFPVRHALRLSCDLIEYASRHMPKFYPLQIKGVNISEGGANMAQEIGYCFSNAACYLDECLRRGLSVDQVAAGMTYFLSTTPHLFEEVAKYRAARRLWARMVKERYGAQNPASMALKFTAIACPLWLQFEEPELNLVRAAVAGLAQALGGAQATPHPGFDEVYAIPNQKSQNLALGTQQVLAEETNITKTVDPLGGSYYVEWLTDQVERKIVEVMQQVQSRGGSLAAIDSGYMKREIMDYWSGVERDIESGKVVIVRRNKYRVAEDGDPRAKLELHQPDSAGVRRYIERVKQLKRDRDNARVQSHLERLGQAARGSDNLMPYLIEAAKDYVTLGEMTAALKQVFGQFKAPAIV